MICTVLKTASKICLYPCINVVIPFLTFCLLFDQNPGKQGHEIQSSTSELINGLVSLVHQQTMPEIAQEAMEVGIGFSSFPSFSGVNFVRVTSLKDTETTL